MPNTDQAPTGLPSRRQWKPPPTLATVVSPSMQRSDTPPIGDVPENSSGTLLVVGGAQPVRLDSDVVVDFTVPEVPSYVTLRGKVMRSDGTPSKGAYVRASTNPTSDIGTFFSVIITTDAKGEFRMRALPGQNYSIYIDDFGN